jgi:hypothetical protein
MSTTTQKTVSPEAKERKKVNRDQEIVAGFDRYHKVAYTRAKRYYVNWFLYSSSTAAPPIVLNRVQPTRPKVIVVIIVLLANLLATNNLAIPKTEL